jgi:phosphopantetheinyl transferase
MHAPPPPLPAGLFRHGEAPAPIELAPDGLAKAASQLARDGRVILMAHEDWLPADLPVEGAADEADLRAERGERALPGALARRRITRAVLARAGGYHPKDWTIRLDENGAPRLEGPEPGWFVSYSARGPLGLIGMARQPIGVDLEIEDPALDIPFNILTADEARVIRGFAPSLRNRLFFRLWAAKEAIAKARGVGFREPPERISLPMPGIETTLVSSKHPMIVLTREGLSVFESGFNGRLPAASLRITIAVALG